MFEFLNTDALGNFKLIALGYIALLWISILIWVTRDALARSSSILFQAFSILLTIAIPIIGVLLYLIIRPSKTQMERYYEQLEANVLEDEKTELEKVSRSCDKCFTDVQEDYAFCPNCAFQLKKVCAHCKKTFPDKWSLCPYCGKEPKKASTPRSNKKSAKAEVEENGDELIIINDK